MHGRALALTTIAIVSITALAHAQHRPTGIVVETVTRSCGTCATPRGEAVPAPRVRLMLRRAERDRVIARRTTRADGSARFVLSPGRYCVTAESLAAPAPVCFEVVTGRTMHYQIDVEVCPDLRCSGTEP